MSDPITASLGGSTPLATPALMGGEVQKQQEIKKEEPKVQLPPPSPDEFKKLTAQAKSLGFKPDYFDENGQIKANKIPEVRARVQQAFDAKMKEVSSKGLKMEDPMVAAGLLLPHLLRDTEFGLLSPADQKKFLEDNKFPQSLLKSYQPSTRPLHKQMAQAGRMEGMKRAALTPPDFGAMSRLFDLAAQFDPNSTILRMEAGKGKQKWASSETDPKVKAQLYHEANLDFEMALKADPKNSVAQNFKNHGMILEAKALHEQAATMKDSPQKTKLENQALSLLNEGIKAGVILPDGKQKAYEDPAHYRLMGDIYTALKKPEEASKAYDQAAKIILNNFEKKLSQANVLSQDTKRSPAERQGERVAALEKLNADLKEIEGLSFTDPNLKLHSLVLKNEFHQSLYSAKLYSFEAPTNVPTVESNPVYKAFLDQRNKELAPYKSRLDASNAEIKSTREDMIQSLKVAPNAHATIEQVKTAQALIALDKLQKNNETLLQDLGRLTDLIGQLPQDNKSAVKIQTDAYCTVLKEWMGLRDQMTGTDTPLKLSMDASAITDKMRYLADRIHERAGYIDGKNAQDRVKNLLSDIVDLNDHKLLEGLHFDGLENYVKAIQTVDSKFEAAKKIENVQERRTALLAAMNEYVSLRAHREVGQVIQSLEASAKDAPDLVKLQIYTAVNQSLQGTGLQGAHYYQRVGEELADKMSGELVGGSRDQNVQNFLMARTYYEAIGNQDKTAALNLKLETMRNVYIDLLKNGDPANAGQKITDPNQRLKMIHLCMQIDQGLTSYETQSALKNSDQKEKLESNLSTRWNFYRQEIAGNSKANPAQKMEAMTQLASIQVSYQPYTKGNESLLKSDFITAQNQLTETAMTSLFSSMVIRQDPPLNSAESKIAEAVQKDFKTLILDKLKEGKPEWFAELSAKNVGEFAQAAQNAHVLLSNAKEPNNPQANLRFLQAAQMFSQLGLKDRVKECVTPLADQAMKNADAGQKASMLINLAQIYQQAVMKDEANGLF
ncbi:MAG: hypothetical protein JNK65_02865, partial [Deltaproteobacteria bacterium]|nr:hypothetical protein [Deltaproteobacteria bacterium]